MARAPWKSLKTAAADDLQCLCGKLRRLRPADPTTALLWGRRNPDRVFAAVFVTLVAVVIANRHLGWGIEWGNVATWASAVASATVAITLAAVTHSRDERAEVALDKMRAIGVQMNVTRENVRQPLQRWKVRVENHSGEPIYRLAVGRVQAWSATHEGKDPVRPPGVVLVNPPSEDEGARLDDGEVREFAVELGTGHAVGRLLIQCSWTSPGGRRFTSAFRQVSGVIDPIPVWDYIGKDEYVHGELGLFRP